LPPNFSLVLKTQWHVIFFKGIDVTSHTLDNALKIGIPVAAVILVAIILVVLVWRKKKRPTKVSRKQYFCVQAI